MHRGCVVPHQEIADLPFVPVLKLRPQAVRMQFLDQRDTLVVWQPFDSNTLASGDVERLAARPSMGPDDGVCDVRSLLELLLRQLGPGTVLNALARGVTMDRLQSRQPSLHRFRQGLVCGNGVCEQGILERPSGYVSSLANSSEHRLGLFKYEPSVCQVNPASAKPIFSPFSSLMFEISRISG